MRRFLIIVILLLTPSITILASTPPQTPDEARRFGVVEKDVRGGKSSRWSKIVCSQDFFGRYRDYDEITTFLKSGQLSTGTLTSIGKSVQGRDIHAIEFNLGGTTNESGATVRRRTVLALAGIHGREWISTMGLLFALSQLTQTSWVKTTTPLRLIAIPLVNPDGYARTFTDGVHTKEKFAKGAIEKEMDIPDRYYRKNAGDVDLNRNFGPAKTVWGVDNSTKSLKLVHSDVYQGKTPFSQPETMALKVLTDKLKDELVGLIDFHCCIGAVLGPPYRGMDDEEEASVAVKENERVGMQVVAALNKAGKDVTKFIKGDGEPGKYAWRKRERGDYASGTSSSWAFNELLLDNSYVVELRGKFVAPCFEIKQIGKEVWFALKVLMEHTPSIAMSKEARKIARRVRLKSGGIMDDDNDDMLLLQGSRRLWAVLGLVVVGMLWWISDRKRRKMMITWMRVNRNGGGIMISGVNDKV